MFIPMEKEHIPGMVALHLKLFPDDFITQLGQQYLLNAHYPYFIDSDLGFGFVHIQRGKVVGFIVGDFNSAEFNGRFIHCHWIRLMNAALFKIIRYPLFVKQLWMTALRMLKGLPEFGETGELAYIAVDSELRRQGIGEKLCLHLFDALKNDGVDRCTAKTLKENRVSNKFYQGMGFLPIHEYRYNAKNWVIYQSKLSTNNG